MKEETKRNEFNKTKETITFQQKACLEAIIPLVEDLDGVYFESEKRKLNELIKLLLKNASATKGITNITALKKHEKVFESIYEDFSDFWNSNFGD